MSQDTLPTIMGRIREEIDVDGRKCWTLFDSGARHSYVTHDAAHGLTRQTLPKPLQTRLGGMTHPIQEICLVVTEIDGHPVHFEARIIDDIGRDEEGRNLDMLIGALAMQGWGIKLDLQNERLDFTHFTTDFVEY